MALLKCRECGKELSDKADKCPHCGNPLKIKRPGTAGLYNFLMPGAGYIYNGNRIIFGCLVLAATCLSTIAIFAHNLIVQMNAFDYLSYLIMWAAFTVDAVFDAIKINQTEKAQLGTPSAPNK